MFLRQNARRGTYSKINAQTPSRRFDGPRSSAPCFSASVHGETTLASNRRSLPPGPPPGSTMSDTSGDVDLVAFCLKAVPQDYEILCAVLGRLPAKDVNTGQTPIMKPRTVYERREKQQQKNRTCHTVNCMQLSGCH